MKTFGILTAMECETEAIVECLENVYSLTVGPTTFYEGDIGNHKVVVGLCGIGKVNAAMSTTLMIDHYKLDTIINIGTAGGLSEYERVLDVVVADEICEYDLDVNDWGKGYGNPKTCITLDKELVDRCEKLLYDAGHLVFRGKVATGDTFVCKKEHLDNIFYYYPESLACEMEGAAIAKVAKAFDIPCLVIRSLSDIAVKEGNDLVFEEYAKLAAKRAAEWTKQLIEKL